MIIFSAIYGLLNAYVTSQFFNIFGISSKLWFYIIFLTLTLSFPVATIIETLLGNLVTRILYTIAATWMGILFISFIVFLAYNVISLFITIPGIIVILTISAITIYGIINASRIHIIDVDLKAPFNADFVHISDIHIGSVHKKDFMQKIISKITPLKPDAVFITGDFLDGPHKYGPEVLKPLDQIKAPIFYSYGNHEHYVGDAKINNVIKHTHITPLRNKVTTFKGIQIIGVDDSESRTNLKRTLDKLKIDKSKYSILLYHRPAERKAAIEHNINLMISGHTHGGQIVPFNLLVALMFRPSRGLHKEGSLTYYISTGTGTWGPPIRIGSKNEIVHYRLRK